MYFLTVNLINSSNIMYFFINTEQGNTSHQKQMPLTYYKYGLITPYASSILFTLNP